MGVLLGKDVLTLFVCGWLGVMLGVVRFVGGLVNYRPKWQGSRKKLSTDLEVYLGLCCTLLCKQPNGVRAVAAVGGTGLLTDLDLASPTVYHCKWMVAVAKFF